MRTLGADPIKKSCGAEDDRRFRGLPLLTGMANMIGMLGGMAMARRCSNIPSNFFIAAAAALSDRYS